MAAPIARPVSIWFRILIFLRNTTFYKIKIKHESNERIRKSLAYSISKFIEKEKKSRKNPVRKVFPILTRNISKTHRLTSFF